VKARRLLADRDVVLVAELSGSKIPIVKFNPEKSGVG